MATLKEPPNDEILLVIKLAGSLGSTISRNIKLMFLDLITGKLDRLKKNCVSGLFLTILRYSFDKLGWLTLFVT